MKPWIVSYVRSHPFICSKQSMWYRRHRKYVVRKKLPREHVSFFQQHNMHHSLRTMGFGHKIWPGLWLWEEYYRYTWGFVSASHKEPTCSSHPCRHHWCFLTSPCPSVFCGIWLLCSCGMISHRALRSNSQILYVFLCSSFTKKGGDISWNMC